MEHNLKEERKPSNISIRKHNKFIDANVAEQKSQFSNETRSIASMNDNKVLFACIAKMQLLYKDLSLQKIEETVRKKLSPIFDYKRELIIEQIFNKIIKEEEGEVKLQKLDYAFEVALNQESQKSIKKIVTTEYEFSMNEIVELTGVSANNAYHLRRRLSHLQFKEAMRIVEYTVDENYESVEQEIVDIILIPTIRTKRGSISFEINKAAIPYFFALTKNFTQLSLNHIKNFSSSYSLRLYEICQMIRKIQNNMVYTFEELQPKFGTNYKEYRFFKAQILKPALLEVNERSDITVEVIENKKYKAEIKISFKVKLKNGSETTLEAEDLSEELTNEKIANFISLRTYFKRINTINQIEDINKYGKRMLKAIKDGTVLGVAEDIIEAKASYKAIPEIKKLLAKFPDLFSGLTWDEKYLTVRSSEPTLNSYGYVRLGDTANEALQQLLWRTREIKEPREIVAEEIHEQIRSFETIWEKLADAGFIYKTVDGMIQIDADNISKWKAELEERVIKNPRTAMMYFKIEDGFLMDEFEKYIDNLK